jgi:hypothetical protein
MTAFFAALAGCSALLVILEPDNKDAAVLAVFSVVLALLAAFSSLVMSW